MGRLNLVASNPVKDGIDAFTALSANYRADDAAKLAAAKDARDATTQGLQQQAAQNQLTEYGNLQQDRQAGAIRMKIGAGIALTPEEQMQAQKMSGVSQEPGVPVQQGIPLAMPADPRAATMQAAKGMAPSPLWKVPENLTKEQEADHNALINTFGKMNQQPDYIPTPEEYKLLAREVVNNPAFKDSSLAEQHKALGAVNSMFSQLKGITQPTLITDPNILAAVDVAFPRIGQGSNLPNAKPNKIYVQPSPDGDPSKALLTIGISGTNAQGEVVDGVVTHNRSSDPNDTVMTVTGGAWMDMAQKKKQTLDGLLAYQAEHGNKEALPIYEQMQGNRELATRMITIAKTLPEGSVAQKKIYGEAQMLMSGKITAAVASATMEKVYHPEEVAAAAAQTHSRAIELEGIKTKSAAEIHASDRASAERVASGNNQTAITVAGIHEKGRKDSESKTAIRADSAEARQLNDKITELVLKKSSIVTETEDPLTGKTIRKVTSHSEKDLADINGEIERQKKEYARKTGQEYVPPKAIPVAAAPAAPPANRPPLSSFKR